MPNFDYEQAVKQLEGGKIEVNMPTGERFVGTPEEVQRESLKSLAYTKEDQRRLKAENERFAAERQQWEAQHQPAAAQPQNTDEAALDQYWLEKTGKVLGYKSGDEFRQDVLRIKSTSERQANEQVAADFMLACPDFPSTQDAVDKLAAYVEQRNWEYTEPNLMAAHLVCLRQGAYKPLNSDEINMANNQAASQQQTRVPPPPPGGNNPDGTQNNQNPWQQSTDELRKQLLSQGGLGKALLDLKPGETFGG